MYRKALLGVGALALSAGVSLGVASGVAVAKAPPVTFSGAITCTATGTVSFSQGLVNGGTTPVTVTAKLKLRACSDSGETNGSGSTVTITKGSFFATSSGTVANNCGAILAAEALPALNGEIKWAGHGGSVAPTSTASISPFSLDNSTNTNEITASGTPNFSAGSFASQTGTLSGLESKQPGNTLDATCGTTKGLKTIAVGKVAGQVTGSFAIQAGGGS
jgi:hypothetical protein